MERERERNEIIYDSECFLSLARCSIILPAFATAFIDIIMNILRELEIAGQLATYAKALFNFLCIISTRNVDAGEF